MWEIYNKWNAFYISLALVMIKSTIEWEPWLYLSRPWATITNGTKYTLKLLWKTLAEHAPEMNTEILLWHLNRKSENKHEKYCKKIRTERNISLHILSIQISKHEQGHFISSSLLNWIHIFGFYFLFFYSYSEWLSSEMYFKYILIWLDLFLIMLCIPYNTFQSGK